MNTLKIVIDSIKLSDIEPIDVRELEYLVNIISSCMVMKNKHQLSKDSLAIIRGNIMDKLVDDRMDTYYSDDTIDNTIDILNRIIVRGVEGVLEYTLENYRITINEMNRLCIILRLLVKENIL